MYTPVESLPYPFSTDGELNKQFDNLTSENLSPNVDISAWKTKTFAFNHLLYFAIDRQALWKKEKYADKPWKRIHIEGVPTEVYCDGANLGVVVIKDGEREFVSKKCLKEWHDQTTNRYCYEDTSDQDNWRISWYHFHGIEKILRLPILRWLFPYANRRLIIPQQATINFSHRGLYNRYYEDPHGNQHHERYGISQLVMIDTDKRTLKYADPGLPAGFLFSHDIPRGFSIYAFDVSASTFMLYGYDHQGTAKIITKIVDFDIKGYHPLMWLNGSYLQRALPPEDWKEHPLPILNERADLIHHVTIEQTGEGNAARRMIILGYNQQGEEGYYWKFINNQDWKFVVNHDNRSENRTHAESPSS